jgi:hypothetical protein
MSRPIDSPEFEKDIKEQVAHEEVVYKVEGHHGHTHATNVRNVGAMVLQLTLLTTRPSLQLQSLKVTFLNGARTLSSCTVGETRVARAEPSLRFHCLLLRLCKRL